MKKDKIDRKMVADLNYFAERIEKTFSGDIVFESLLEEERDINLEDGILFYKGVEFRELYLMFDKREVYEIMKRLNKILSKYLDLKFNQVKSKFDSGIER